MPCSAQRGHRTPGILSRRRGTVKTHFVGLVNVVGTFRSLAGLVRLRLSVPFHTFVLYESGLRE